MVRKRGVILILLALFFFSLGSVDAESTFHKNSSSIEKKYAEGEYVKGRVNMSFTEQENKRFASNFRGGIKLYDLLNNLSLRYTCDPKNCRDTYSISSGSVSKELNSVNKKLA